ncbi:MAG: glutamine-hydrolyzing carbamoyl-phosphate synthase small subunit [Candidatus Omnitrophota bacterium]
MDKKAILFLEDATTFKGETLGASGEAIGPVVVNTAVVGYQEMITDSVNAGKMLVLTYPLIGNYGINEKFNETDTARVSGLVIKEQSRIFSNWQAKTSLEEFLKKQNIVGITGVDTRTLAVKIRDGGEMLGMISSENLNAGDAKNKLAEFARRKNSLLEQISAKEVRAIPGKGKKLAIIDLGISNSVLAQLSSLNFDITIFPYDTPAKEILNLKPAGIVVSGGPENDLGLSKAIESVKEILGRVPLFGFSTGHEVIATAAGASIKKMKTGHHGVNYPVKTPDSFKGEITAQNHSYVVDEASLNTKDIEILEKNINDNTIEKLTSKKLKFISIQYCPASPGLGEVNGTLKEFAELVKNA